MSLLLDALKKAAEQKAEKSREDIPGAETSDETIVVSAPEDISELEDPDKNLLNAQRELEDETQIDDSRLQTQLEDTHLEPGDDETSIEIPDPTETQHTDLSTQMIRLKFGRISSRTMNPLRETIPSSIKPITRPTSSQKIQTPPRVRPGLTRPSRKKTCRYCWLSEKTQILPRALR
jgi:hypothetical protein